MGHLSGFALALPLAALVISCTTGADRAARSADSATAGGTIAPAITIHSITFLVDDAELTLSEGDLLPVRPGSQVTVAEIRISVGPFAGDGGEVCVDFAPTRDSGEEVLSAHTGTHMVRVAPGPMTMPGPDGSWTSDGSWAGIAVVANHWPGVKTQDHVCADAKCERDHRFVLLLRPAGTD